MTLYEHKQTPRTKSKPPCRNTHVKRAEIQTKTLVHQNVKPRDDISLQKQ